MSAGKPRRRTRHEEHEEHENHERWLVSYADMITVLMALFIVMFAISNVDRDKFAALKASLASSFGNPIVAIDGGPSAVEDQQVSPEPFNIGAAAMAEEDPNQARAVEAAVAAKERAKADARRKSAEREVARLEAVRQKILAALRAKGLAGSVRFRYDERGLVVSVVTDKVVFAADRAELAPAGRRVLDAIGPVLQVLPNDIAVEGHTNQAPVAPRYYATEWELSTARAVSVLRYLVEHRGLAERRMTAAGLADQRPLIPGVGPTANRVNRRVEIVVLSTLPPQDRALLPSVAPPAATTQS